MKILEVEGAIINLDNVRWISQDSDGVTFHFGRVDTIKISELTMKDVIHKSRTV